MPALYYLNATFHVLAAMLWLGGMFFLAVVSAPALRGVQPPQLRAQLFQELGRRFRAVGWIAIAVLIVTGVINVAYRGWLHWSVLGSAAFWNTATGRSLAAKLAAVIAMVSISAVHDFLDGPRASRAVPGSAQALAFRRRASLLARVNAILGVILVVAAVRLARG